MGGCGGGGPHIKKNNLFIAKCSKYQNEKLEIIKYIIIKGHFRHSINQLINYQI